MKGFPVTALIALCALGGLTPTRIPRAASQPKSSGRQPTTFKVGFLAASSIPDACNCTFTTSTQARRRSPRYIFASNIEDEEKTAWINIDGKDVELELVRKRDPKNENVGSRSTRTYEASGIRLVATYTTTWVCPPRDENCEMARYKGVFTVTKNGVSKSLKLKGECGC
jgi:hypothetical protein